MSAVWKVCVLFSLLVAFTGIARNGASIDDVCATVQAQQDRNRATVQRSLDGLVAIQSGRGKNIPGYGYYRERPQELRAAITRTQREIHIYEGNVC